MVKAATVVDKALDFTDIVYRKGQCGVENI